MSRRTRGWWACLFLKHRWVKDDVPRLYVLDDSWPPRYTDGLPDGQVYKCSRCKALQVR